LGKFDRFAIIRYMQPVMVVFLKNGRVQCPEAFIFGCRRFSRRYAPYGLASVLFFPKCDVL
jgi:hypothetical protein